jgi:signal transduction histidine kinase
MADARKTLDVEALSAEVNRLRARLAALEPLAIEGHDLAAALEAERTETRRQRQQADTLSTELARYRELIDFAPVPLLVLSRAGLIEYASHSAAALLGRSGRHSVEGMALVYWVAQGSRQAFLDHLRHCRSHDACWREEIELVPNAGEPPVPIEMHSHCRPGDGDSLLTTLVDLTDRKVAEVERRRWAEAEAGARAKDHFLAALGHELRNPLAPIVNRVQVMRIKGGLPADYQPMLDRIERNLWQEVRLVDDLLDTSRIVGGKLDLRPERVPLHELLREMLEQLAPEYRRAQVGSALALEAGKDHVQADLARLRQVFWNLLNNSAKFTPAGGWVEIRTCNPEPAGVIRIAISDTGLGMDPDRVQRLFEPFEQAIDGYQGGLGLGLAIAKGIVELHGGRIEAHSDGTNQGSTFIVTLPLAEAPAKTGEAVVQGDPGEGGIG